VIATIVYPALADYAPLSAIVDARIYRDFAGDAPTAPYVVWSILAAPPDRNLSGRPPSDRYSVSIDVYSTDRAESDALVIAARDAMEAIGVLSSGPQSLGYDPSTALYRYTLTIDVHVQR
jgi:hypothetical protein